MYSGNTNLSEHISVPASQIEKMIRESVGTHYMIAFSMLIILSIVVVYLLFKKSETMQGGSLMRFQQFDSTGMSEGLSTDPSAAAPATVVATTAAVPTDEVHVDDVNYYANVIAAATTSGATLNAQILQDPNYACATRTPVTSDAWAWMSSEVQTTGSDTFITRPSKSDSQLSAVLAGH